jgi:hypothetical protein
MAKINKTQTVEAAKTAARKSAAVNAKTAAEIAEMKWNERRQAAYRLMLESDLNALDTNYADAAQDAFVDTALDIWQGKLRALDTARRVFARAKTGKTVEEARVFVVDFVKALNLRGARISDGGVEIERVWGAGATLYWRFAPDFDARIYNPDNANESVTPYSFRTELSWSGTTRNISAAEVAMKTYRELLDVAHELEAVMARETVYTLYGA